MSSTDKRLYIIIVAIVAVSAVIAAAIHLTVQKPKSAVPAKSNQSQAANQSASTKPAPASNNKQFAHIFIIMEENKPYNSIVGSSQAPHINSLIRQYTLANNYFAVLHPSLPNYLAVTSGSNHGINNDCNPPSAGCEINATNIADEIEHSGHTWKEYAESMPSPCYTYNSGEYATKHNPFIYYSDIVNNHTRCVSHVVPFSNLARDLKSTSTTPDYAFITPNLCNDMHDCSVVTGDQWLAAHVPEILQSKAFTVQNSLLVITWDEGNAASNHVPAILIGPQVKSGYTLSGHYTHYSLLHTVEANWNLAPLTDNDARASVMTGFLK